MKYDEFECFIYGIYFINFFCINECYYWNNLYCLEKLEKVLYNFDLNFYFYIVVNIGFGVSILFVEFVEKFLRISGIR